MMAGSNDFAERLQAKLMAYRTWAQKNCFLGCRLVHYTGITCGAIDVPLSEIEVQIEGCLAEGFHVDWATHDERLYLRIWEAPEPDWEYVFQERPIPTFDADGKEVSGDNLLDDNG